MKKFGTTGTQKTPTYDTLKTLMERISPLVVDANAVKELVTIVYDHVEGIADEFEDRAEEQTEVRGLKLLQVSVLSASLAVIYILVCVILGSLYVCSMCA